MKTALARVPEIILRLLWYGSFATALKAAYWDDDYAAGTFFLVFVVLLYLMEERAVWNRRDAE